MKINIGEFKTTDKIREYVKDILDSGRITEGKYVKLFEEKVAKYLGTKHAIAVTNGTVSLQLLAHILKRRGLRTVCIPALTFPATANAFINAGMKVRICEVKEDLTIDVEKITERNKNLIDVMVPVHLMGYAADMVKINEFSNKYNWITIEDTAEAFGGEIKGRKLGCTSHFGSYSFYVSHNITGGELGLITTEDDYMNEQIRSMKNHGRNLDSKLDFKHDLIGSNYKTNEFCAAIALAELEDVDKSLKARLDNATYFSKNIKNKNIKNYPITKGFSPLGYPLRAINENFRNKICNVLEENSIECRKMFPCLSNQKAFNIKKIEDSFPMANRLEKEMLYIPVHKYLTEEDKEFIVKVLNNIQE